MWRPLQFLSLTLPLKSTSMTADVAAKAESEALKALDSELARDIASLRLALCKWLSRFASDITAHPRKGEVLLASRSLLIQAVLLASRVSQLLRSTVAGHFELNRPIPQKILPSVLGAIEVHASWHCARMHVRMHGTASMQVLKALQTAHMHICVHAHMRTCVHAYMRTCAPATTGAARPSTRRKPPVESSPVVHWTRLESTGRA